MNLLLLIGIPLLTAIAVLLSRNTQQVRWISLSGSLVQLILSFVLFFSFRNERALGNNTQMLFEQNYPLFASWNINFHLGVDGISVAMILLTSFVLIAGVLVSWNIEKMTKEFYFLLILLALGAYGFFISLDLFVLFFFLEISVIPKYLLIGIWGSGRKEYSANKLALMLMGGSALILVGILGLYFSSGYSFDIIELSHKNILRIRSTCHLSVAICWLWSIHCIISFSYLGTRWSFIGANGRFYVPCRYIYETRRLWLFAGCYLPAAGRSKRICYYHYRSFRYCDLIWRLRYHDAEGPEIYQCLFFGKSRWV